MKQGSVLRNKIQVEEIANQGTYESAQGSVLEVQEGEQTWPDDALRAGGQPVPKDRASLVFANSLSRFLFKLNLAPS